MVRLLIIGFTGALVLAGIPVKADVRSYCEAYARNQADTRLMGSAILGAKLKPSPEAWKERNDRALADCEALYAGKPATRTVTEAEPVKTESVKTEPVKTKAQAAKPVAPTLKKIASASDPAPLVPGTAAWEDYCAAKYASFNRATGTYTSLSGKQRPCRVTVTKG